MLPEKSDSGQAVYVWMAGLLGRPLTQDEADQFMLLVRQYVLDVVKAMQRMVQ